jgi:two-component system sensor histidine kinase KdpD
LAICSSFVEALGGTIAAGNRPDRAGSVFTITLPETLAVALVATP